MVIISHRQTASLRRLGPSDYSPAKESRGRIGTTSLALHNTKFGLIGMPSANGKRRCASCSYSHSSRIRQKSPPLDCLKGNTPKIGIMHKLAQRHRCVFKTPRVKNAYGQFKYQRLVCIRTLSIRSNPRRRNSFRHTVCSNYASSFLPTRQNQDMVPFPFACWWTMYNPGPSFPRTA